MAFLKASILSLLLNQRGSIGFGHKHRLMNEAIDGGGDSGGEFNIHEAANEIIGDDSQGASTEGTSSEGQADSASQNDGGDKALSPEEILAQVAKEGEDPAQFADLLKGVNSLGMIRNGLPVAVESPEQLKELIQKGFDYTQKTMEHAELVKTKDAEFQQKETSFKERETQLAQAEQAIQNEVYFNTNLMAVVEKLKTEDPELFTHLDQLYQREEKSFLDQQKHIKQFEGKFSEIENKLKGFETQKHQEQLTGIKQSWEKDLSEVQTKVAAPLEKLGLKVDWENKVKKIWEADASNKMTVEQALYAAYGAEISKANESHRKLLETKTKTQQKLLNRTGVTGGQRGASETKQYPVGDFMSILNDAAATM